MNDMESMEHTIVFQEGRITPVGHLVNTRPEKVERMHVCVSAKTSYIEPQRGSSIMMRLVLAMVTFHWVRCLD